MQTFGKTTERAQLVRFQLAATKRMGLMKLNRSAVFPRINIGEHRSKGIQAIERLGLVKGIDAALLHHKGEIAVERRHACILLIALNSLLATNAHDESANKKSEQDSKHHAGQTDSGFGHNGDTARYRRILAVLILGLAGDRAHIERLIVGAVAPRLAHIDNSIGVERLAIVPRGDLHRRPSLPVKVDLGPRVRIGSRQVERYTRVNRSGQLIIRRPVALDIARGDSLGSKRERRRRGKVGRVALCADPKNHATNDVSSV